MMKINREVVLALLGVDAAGQRLDTNTGAFVAMAETTRVPLMEHVERACLAIPERWTPSEIERFALALIDCNETGRPLMYPDATTTLQTRVGRLAHAQRIVDVLTDHGNTVEITALGCQRVAFTCTGCSIVGAPLDPLTGWPDTSATPAARNRNLCAAWHLHRALMRANGLPTEESKGQ